jgi:hypothetical protein
MTSTTFATPPDPDDNDARLDQPPTLEQILEIARKRIEVSDAELNEARQRRKRIEGALKGEFPGSETYVNGSVAHGDALDPLTDVDLGVVVAEAVETHGPGKKGCSDLEERAANAIRAELEDDFPDLRIEWKDRKRSILVNFRKPVAESHQEDGSADFTADVIVAIDNTEPRDNAGLWIPRYLGWDRSHPQEHTRMVAQANKKSRSTYARVVRLLKHWNRSNGKPVCSWNIKALGLDVLTQPTRLLDGLRDWFTHAIDSLSEGLTGDPAGVAEKPISINDDMTRTEVVARLQRAQDRLEKAIAYEESGYPLQAHEELAKMFNDEDMLPFPNPDAVRVEAARKIAADRKASNTGTSAGALGAGYVANVGDGAGQRGRDVRSWGER